MKILALEFSAQERSVAVATESGEMLAVVRERDFRGVTGMTIVDRALQEARSTPPEISKIALGLGPGSYTGIRSSIAIAQGWQLGREVELIGISSALCLAHEAQAQGLRGTFSIIIDAQRREVYWTTFEIGEKEVREIDPLQIVPLSEIPQEHPVIGPDSSRLATGGRDLSPLASTLALLALTAGKSVRGEELEPIYLRQATFAKAPAPRHIP